VDTAISDAARDYVKAHGGRLFVRAHAHRCCHGAVTLLDSTTETPSDADDFVDVGADGIEVRFHGQRAGEPHELVIELRGVWRRHPVAYWDGCAFKP
jgi:hypothetical protein